MDRLRRVASSTPFLGLVVAVATWNAQLLPPLLGVDGSWHAALYLAAHLDLAWGTEVIHSYGPLGFLELPIAYYDDLALLAMARAALLHLALTCTLVWALRRLLPVAVAVAIAFLAALAPIADFVALLALFWALTALDASRPGIPTPALLAGGGLAALELLGKINVGVEVAVVAVICVLAAPGRLRNLATLAGAFAVTLLALWLGAGQSLETLPDFARNSLDILGGYSQAFTAEYQDGFVWQVPLALGAVAGLACLAYLGSADRPRAARIGAAVATAAIGFAVFKEGFMRHDEGHAALFFWTAALIALLLSTRLPAPQALLAAPLALALAATAIHVAPPGFGPRPNPVAHVEDFADFARDAVSAERREQLRLAGAIGHALAYPIPPADLRLLRGHEVHVDPWEVSLIWAFNLRWRPLPVLQNQAYTSRLDQLNAAALLGPSAPDRILRIDPRQGDPGLGSSTMALDDRYPAHDSPAARLAMLCRYRAIATGPAWQILRRVPDRCSDPRPLGSVTAGYGSPVRVPSPERGDEVVLARVHGVEVSGLERLRAFAYRAVQRRVEFDDGAGYRLIPGTADEGLLLRTPPGVDFPPPFAFGPQARTVTFSKGGSEAELRVDFYAIRVRRVAKLTAP